MATIYFFLKRYRFPVVVALILMFVELTVELTLPLLLARIIDDGIMQADLSMVVRWGSIMIGLSLLAFVAGIVNSFYAAHASQSIGHDLRSELYEKVHSFSLSILHRYPTSSLITRLTNDVTQIQNTIFMSLRIMLRAPLLVFGGTVMAIIVNPKLASFFLVLIPALILFMVFMMRKGAVLFRRVQERLDRVNQVTRENLIGMRLIRAFVRRTHEGKRFVTANDELRKQTVTALRWMEVTMPLLLLLMNVAIMAVLWFGSFDVQTGTAQVGEVVAIINYGTRITSALSLFSMIVIIFSRAEASTKRVKEILSEESEGRENGKNEETRINGEITFDRLSFHYPGSPVAVLSDVSFSVKRGETLAVLGATGAGKSTLLQLILRLYDPTAGAIRIDGKDVQDIGISRLRQEIGYVPQEVLLFSGSVRDNLAFGKEDATQEDIKQAAKAAQIHETIMAMPNQLDTKIGQKGINLSGGQKQRMSIARALVRKPAILLFDDCTSALDVKTESELLRELASYQSTVLIVTQKLSTAIEADAILLLEDGKVAAHGQHEELLRTSSLYQRLYESQYGKRA
ncbi:ABC transporter ATP-binding protein [Halalkalibacterium halodurans]|uniref:ABC transporter ATP-binding protein n=1 Tax=Halalkalibacterium halodurans TaxID=86665 RepID=UPI002AAA543E|nr:ABC transporter ATP-binding protein [Halalkalibacterium halodurans]MDY7221313.1 ABC transporter ATP-binding protein [Halalkalibacterium halodurans]MDY7240552.1 ABC transporter ATP-binding protein [Halalkalibacterium halodurans]MED4081415.1 ABC transporter ATP-binding protein [Halalkalibacterium halodurans]MED4083303.1 ABC transporter ATP-binding protein [Halalkalibacterium halodurans]MED4106506.1 ABC transporter ATP-binding protein [Halalkalibacterium halodurans]